MKLRPALCALAFLPLAACVPKPTPSLYSDREILSRLRDAYGMEFCLLSSEPYEAEGSFVLSGRQYTAAPADDHGFRFEVIDMIQLQNPGPIPVIFPKKYHVFRDFFLDEHLLRELLRFCAENGLPCEPDGMCITLPEDGWEETLARLTQLVDRLGTEFPYNTGRAPSSLYGITFRRDIYPGVFITAHENFYSWADGTYRLDGEAVAGKLRHDYERDLTAISLGTALRDFLEDKEIAYSSTLPEQYEETTYPLARFHIFLPDEQELDRVFPLLGSFFAEAAASLPGPGAANAWFLIDFQKSELSTIRETCHPFREEAPYLYFDTETVRESTRRTLFPTPSDGRESGDSGDLIVGDRITIDGNNLIVERGDETVIIDRSGYSGPEGTP